MSIRIADTEIENVYLNGQKMERVFVNGVLVYEATIYVDKPTVSAKLTYNATTQKPTITGYNSAAMTISGTQSATNAGTYTIKFTLNKGYAWVDGTTNDLTFTWSIAKKSVVKPTLSGSYTYNKNAQTVTISGYNSAAMTISGTQSATNAGTYHVYFTLNSNYLWADGTTASLDLTWRIKNAVMYKAIVLTGGYTIPSGYNRLQYFLVGGGGGGGRAYNQFKAYNNGDMYLRVGGGGGGGGYTVKSSEMACSAGDAYYCVIGNGGAARESEVDTSHNTVSIYPYKGGDGGTTQLYKGSNASGTLLMSAAGGSGGGSGTGSNKYSSDVLTGDIEAGVRGGSGGSGGGAGAYLREYNAWQYGHSGGATAGASNGGTAATSYITKDEGYTDDDDHSIQPYLGTQIGAGGIGQKTSTMFGSTIYSGGGGGGAGGSGINGAGGNYGGGAGGSEINDAGSSGVAGSGGGGGGAMGFGYGAGASGSGGSGTVIFKLWEV